MRCLVKLRATREQTYRPAYHVKLQGLLYELLKEAGFQFVHDEYPFKFLTFSNIFPPKDMSVGDERTWIVASPHEELIEEFADTLSTDRVLEVGDQGYRVEYTSVFSVTPDSQGRMQTGTPIVVRIPAGRCDMYGIEPEYDDVYWRLNHPIKAFKQELEQNLATKYEEYYDESPPERPYFKDFESRKEVGVPLHYAEQDVQIVGTTWEFEYECRTRSMYRLMSMAYSAGLGELNTTGFGFINPV